MSTPLPPALELRDLQVRRGSFELLLPHLELAEGGFLVVVGPSASGKSSLLEVIGGRISPTRGRVAVAGLDITTLPPHRRPVRTCWQVGGETLFPHMSVGRNIEFGLAVVGKPAAERRAIAEELLTSLDLSGLYDRSVDSLSGGQRQRVAIARAVAPSAPLLLLDEVTTGLDPGLRAELRRWLVARHRRCGIAMVYVTHDLTEAAELCRVIGCPIMLLREGRTAQVGSWAALYEHPKSPFVARYLGSVNLWEGWPTEDGVLVKGMGLLPTPEDWSPVSRFYGVRTERVELVPLDEALVSAVVVGISPDRGAIDVTLRRGKVELRARGWNPGFHVVVGESVGLRWEGRHAFGVGAEP